MTQSAMVKRRLGRERVEILVRRQSACSHDCSSCTGGCPSMIREPEVVAVAEDPLGAEPGQQVTVESSTRRVLGLAALLYILPFAAFFAGYLLLAGQSETLAVLGAVAAFAVVLLAVCLPIDRHLRRRRAVTFRVVSLGG